MCCIHVWWRLSPYEDHVLKRTSTYKKVNSRGPEPRETHNDRLEVKDSFKIIFMKIIFYICVRLIFRIRFLTNSVIRFTGSRAHVSVTLQWKASRFWLVAARDIHSKQTSHEFQGRSVSCRNKGDFGNSFIKVFFFFFFLQEQTQEVDLCAFLGYDFKNDPFLIVPGVLYVTHSPPPWIAPCKPYKL